MKIIIIGAGVMGKIFIKAFYKANLDWEICITGKDQEKLKIIKKEFPKVKIIKNNVEAVNNADLVFLSVKPQQFVEVKEEIKNHLKDNVLVVSIMAGISVAKLIKDLSVKNVIRLMPNLGGRVNKSMTTWTSSANVNNKQKKFMAEILCNIGQELFVLDDKMIDKTSLVSGCGPGFFFFMLEQWIQSVEKMGFSRKEAEKLIFTTVDGSVELLRQNMNPMELVGQVASKGGVTEAGLKVLKQADLAKMWKEVFKVAEKRTKELSRE